jgi:hypothetical protein
LTGSLKQKGFFHSDEGAWALYRQIGAMIKKGNKIFLKYKEIQTGAVAKSYMRKGFLYNI